MNIKKNIPNTITCCNLLCGCLAIVQTFEGNLVWAAYLVGLAAIFDFFDGFVARLLNVSSSIGKDLDSLADMVTFGVVPGLVVFQLLKRAIEIYNQNHDPISINIAFIAFIIPILSAVRLAKFNNDTRQSDSFIGLPTPANAILICAIPLILEHNNLEFILNPIFLCLLSIILSLLLIIEIPLFALKFKHFNWKDNEVRYLFLGLSIVLLISFHFVGIPLIIIMYVVLSVLNNILNKNTTS
jgi:CDP-diacylglycerol--serine O-phosphatidyltransferase